MQIIQSRRDFLTTLSAAGTASALPVQKTLADEGPPETPTIRLDRSDTICLAPPQIAEDLLRAEGFTDVRYVHGGTVASGDVDFAGEPQHGSSLAWMQATRSRLTGLHSGCYELFAH